jgi:hypothetical protein
MNIKLKFILGKIPTKHFKIYFHSKKVYILIKTKMKLITTITINQSKEINLEANLH